MPARTVVRLNLHAGALLVWWLTPAPAVIRVDAGGRNSRLILWLIAKPAPAGIWVDASGRTSRLILTHNPCLCGALLVL